jgi:DNA repair protein RadD
MTQLRPYQVSAVDSALNWLRYKDTPAIIVLPTGAGKTHVISAITERYFNAGKRVLILAHRKELLEQSGKVLAMPFGYFSAALGERNLGELVTVAGIQSIARCADMPPQDLIIIDECHRVGNGGEGQYHHLFSRHPAAKRAGLTATPFRLQGGALGWGEIVYSIGYPELLKDGYLSPLINKVKSPPDLSSVHVTAGEYKLDELEYVMADGGLVLEAVRNIKAYSADRRSILIFCVSVKHCHLLGAVMAENGMEARVLSGETPQEEREAIIVDFKAGRLKYLINCEILLDGFDYPGLDMIVCLRPTKSRSLWEQLIGRGVRKAEGKSDCLLIDMGGNLVEHGPLGAPVHEKARRESKRELGKVCPECESYVLPTTKVCPDCQYTFPSADAPKVNHSPSADHKSQPVYGLDAPAEEEEYIVTDVTYVQHKSKKGNLTIRVDYESPGSRYGRVSEWLSPWSDSDWARNQVYKFYKERGCTLIADTKEYGTEELLHKAATCLKKPTKVWTKQDGDYARVVRYEWSERPVQEVIGPTNWQEILDDELPF